MRGGIFTRVAGDGEPCSACVGGASTAPGERAVGGASPGGCKSRASSSLAPPLGSRSIRVRPSPSGAPTVPPGCTASGRVALSAPAPRHAGTAFGAAAAAVRTLARGSTRLVGRGGVPRPTLVACGLPVAARPPRVGAPSAAAALAAPPTGVSCPAGSAVASGTAASVVTRRRAVRGPGGTAAAVARPFTGGGGRGPRTGPST